MTELETLKEIVSFLSNDALDLLKEIEKERDIRRGRISAAFKEEIPRWPEDCRCGRCMGRDPD